MINVHASVERSKTVVDGAGSNDFGFKTVWVGGPGNVAISRNGGKTFTVYNPSNIGFLTVTGEYLGTTAEGTTATGLILGDWA